jgi:Flp pilus assembly protein TadG
LHRARAVRDDSGVAAVEFAMLVPVLLLIMLGGLVFTIALQNNLLVANAADVGAFQLTLSRGATTPYTSTINAINGAASALNTANLKITLTVNGTSCTSDVTCQTALSGAASKQAGVSITYPCNLNVLQINFAPSGCTLSANTLGFIQ